MLAVTQAAAYGPELSPPAVRRLSLRTLLYPVAFYWDHYRMKSGAICGEVRHAERARALLGAPEGVMFCSMHLGPFPYVVQGLARLGFVGHSFLTRHAAGNTQRIYERENRRWKGSMETLMTDSRGSLLRGLRALKSGKALLVFMDLPISGGARDQDGQNELEVPFLNGRIRARAGAVYLAQKAQVPLVPVICWRNGLKGRILEFGEPIAPPAPDSREELFGRTREVFAAFEGFVRRHPAQWAGWYQQELLWSRVGEAPTATEAEFAAEEARLRALLETEPRRWKLASRPNQWTCEEGGAGWIVYEGDSRRVLQVGAETARLLRYLRRGRRLDRVRRRAGSADADLVADLTRLTLAGLLALEPAH